MRRAARISWPRSPSTGSARAFPAPGGSVNRLPFPQSTRHRRALPKFVAITLTSAQDSASETPAHHPTLGPLRPRRVRALRCKGVRAGCLSWDTETTLWRRACGGLRTIAPCEVGYGGAGGRAETPMILIHSAWGHPHAEG